MKKIFFILLLATSFLLVSCNDDSKEVASITEANILKENEEISKLKKELEEIKKENEELQKQLMSSRENQKNINDTDIQKSNSEPNVKVEFLDKINIPKDIHNSRYSDRTDFKIKITNNNTKSIKGIQGFVDIQDIFGVSILMLNCDLVGKTIDADNFIIYEDIGFDINEFMDDNMKVYFTDYKDLNFEYTVTKLVFTDGEIINFN